MVRVSIRMPKDFDAEAAALRVMEDVYRCPHALQYLRAWLADKRETSKDLSGWCERPRICNIAASWLMGDTEGKLKFPNGGTLAERDKAVAKVVAQLQEDPKYFEVLTR